MTDFSSILQATLTPIALISGVGLLLLSMVNRYNHAIDRTRQLIRERDVRQGPELEKLDRSISVIYGRCRIMRNAILCVGSSIACSSAIVLTTAVEGFGDIDLYVAKALFLVLAIVLVVAASVLFVVEVTYSLHALKIDVEG